MELRYEITDEILNNIVEIESMKQFIDHVKLDPQYDSFLKNKALLNCAHASISLSENSLTKEEIKNLFTLTKTKNITHNLTHTQIEVINYLNLLEGLNNYANNFKKYSVELISTFHKNLTKNLDQSDKFRELMVMIEDSKTGDILYIPPDPKEIPSLMDDLVKWLNTTDIQLILKSAIAHYEILKIEPFSDGNGRTSRILTDFILKAEGFNAIQYFSLEEYYNKDKDAYYDALKSVQETRKLTKWLEYFTTGFLNSIKEIKNEIEMMLQLTEDELNLTVKELEIIKYLKLNKNITNKKVQKLFNISSKSSYQYLKKLTNKNLIKKIGKGRSTYYELI